MSVSSVSCLAGEEKAVEPTENSPRSTLRLRAPDDKLTRREVLALPHIEVVEQRGVRNLYELGIFQDMSGDQGSFSAMAHLVNVVHSDRVWRSYLY